MSRITPPISITKNRGEAFESMDEEEGSALLVPRIDPHLLSTGRESSNIDSSLVLRSPNRLTAGQLSPLIQRSPHSTQYYMGEYATKDRKRLYEGFDSSERGIEEDENDSLHPGSTQRVLKVLGYEREKWKDPAEALGVKTIFTVVLAGLALMGLFVVVGNFNDKPNGVQMSLNSKINELSHEKNSSSSSSFPFSPSYFLKQCTKFEDKIAGGRTYQNKGSLSSGNVTIHDPYFSLTEEERKVMQTDRRDYSKVDDQGNKICENTLLYLLDDDFGLTFHLNAISIASALAKTDSRDFFIIDAEWDRGHWEDQFASLPKPDCKPPPPSEMMACPRVSRHWIITPATFNYHFSAEELVQSFGDPQTINLRKEEPFKSLTPYRRQPIFEMARESFLELFKLNVQNQKLLHDTKQEILNLGVWSKGTNGNLPAYISIHVRKGDRHPYEPAHKFDYLPLIEYVDAINSTWNRLRALDSSLPQDPNIYLASDTPLVLEPLKIIAPSSWRYFHLSMSKSKNLTKLSHPHEYAQMHFHAHIPEERIGYTRGQIIDIGFLGGGWPLDNDKIGLTYADFDKPSAMICTVSSNMCQFAALQLGWDEAFIKQKWINIDSPLDKTWEGIEIPDPSSIDSDESMQGMHHH